MQTFSSVPSGCPPEIGLHRGSSQDYLHEQGQRVCHFTAIHHIMCTFSTTYVLSFNVSNDLDQCTKCT